MAPLGVSGFILGVGFEDVQLLVVLRLLPVAYVMISPRSLSLSKLWVDLLVVGVGGTKFHVSSGLS